MACNDIEQMTVRPLVSVIIPCYQQGRYVSDAIASVVEQTYPRIEAIVVNDGSTDDTAKVAASFGDSVRYVAQENRGLSAARNTGLLECTGDYVVFLDADDVLLPDMVSRMVGAIGIAGNSTAAHCGCMITPDDLRDTNWVWACKEEGDLFARLCFGNLFPVHAALTPKAVLEKAGPFDTTLRASEDWDMWLRVAHSGARWVRVPEVLVKYRQHPQTMGKTLDFVLEGTKIVLGRGRAMAAGVSEANDFDSSKFEEAWCLHVLRIAAIPVLEGRFEECRSLLRAELDQDLTSLRPEEMGRVFWESCAGVANIPSREWEALWAKHGSKLLSFVVLLDSLTNQDGFALRFLSGMGPLRQLLRDRQRLTSIENSTSYRLSRRIAGLKFW